MNGAGLTDLMGLTIEAATVTTGPPAQAVLPALPEAVSAARRLVRGTLPWCPRVDDLVLAVSEFATNAVTWSASGRGGFMVVRVRTAPRWARVEVTDEGPARDAAGAGNGWGLPIVGCVTDRSGASELADGRRVAWAEVTWP